MRSGLLCLALASAAMAQQPTFEVASVKVAGPEAAAAPIGNGGFRSAARGCRRPNPGTVNCTNATLRQILLQAYGVPTYRLEGPAWLDSDGYDLMAKLPEGVTVDKVPEMLQALLANRFQVVIHKETRQYSGYEMTVAKGGFKPAEVDRTEVAAYQADRAAVEAGKTPATRPNPSGSVARGAFPSLGQFDIIMSPGGARTSRGKMTMKELANRVASQMNRPVVDKTELKGTYEIELTYMDEPYPGFHAEGPRFPTGQRSHRNLPPGGPGAGPETRAEEGAAGIHHCGQRAEGTYRELIGPHLAASPRHSQVRYFAHMRSVLLALALASAAMAQQPTFEVASVKVATPQVPVQGANGAYRVSGCRRPNPGTVDCTNATLRRILLQAYGVPTYQLEGPAWLDSDRYELMAKLPEGVTVDKIPAMLQALLADRFQVVIHKETRQYPGYEMTVAKGGFKPAEVDPAEVAAYQAEQAAIKAGNAPATPPTSPRPGAPMPMGLIGMRVNSSGAHTLRGKMTMKELAHTITSEMKRPVVDRTELKGAYDIELTYMDEGSTGLRAEAMASASDPTATFLQAVQALGLKLEQKKGPLEFIVVDSAKRVPTEN